MEICLRTLLAQKRTLLTVCVESNHFRVRSNDALYALVFFAAAYSKKPVSCHAVEHKDDLRFFPLKLAKRRLRRVFCGGYGLIIAEVKKSNEDHRSITLEEIELLDQRWRRSDGMDSFIKPFLTNKVAQRVLSFQEENPGFSEIFVTDEHGLNVGQTNKTTDYYQADEDWWTGAYNAGVGKIFHGPIEFDESAQTEAISIYAPIMDPETERAVGVIKAVLSIAAIKVEL